MRKAFGRSPARTKPGRWVTGIMVVLASLVPVWAQEAEVVRVEVDLVTVNVAVSDGGKRPVTGLGAADFLVSDEGRPVALEFFDGQGPASIVLVVDSSESMKNKKWKNLRAAFKKFLARARPGDDFTLVAFGDQARLVTEGVSAEELWRSFTGLEPSGHTALYDAVLVGLEALGRAPRRRKALVLLSDGQDNRSRAGLAEVEREALARRATVYAVGITHCDHAVHLKDERAGREVLAVLAGATGGLAYYPGPDGIRGVLDRIGADLGGQYTVGYYARDATPGWRRIHVAVTAAPGRLRLRYQQRYLKR
jgi:Ca-activated chloride channel homolog